MDQDHLGRGRVHRNCKYYNLRVFDTAYDSGQESDESDISAADVENCADPEWPPTYDWDIDYFVDTKKMSRFQVLRTVMLVEEEKRKEEKKSEDDQVAIEKAHEQKEPTAAGGPPCLESVPGPKNSGLLENIQLNVEKLEKMCNENLICLGQIKELVKQLDERWEMAGCADEPANFQYICKSLAFVSKTQELFAHMQKLVAAQQGATVTFAEAHSDEKFKEPSAPPRGKNPTPSRLPVPITPRKDSAAVSSRSAPPLKPNTSMRFCPQFMARVQLPVQQRSNIRSVPGHSVLLSATPSNLRSRNAAGPLTQASGRTAAALSEKVRAVKEPQQSKPHSSQPPPRSCRLNQNQPAFPRLEMPQSALSRGMAASRNVFRTQAGVASVQRKANNIASYTKETLDMLQKRYRP